MKMLNRRARRIVLVSAIPLLGIATLSLIARSQQLEALRGSDEKTIEGVESLPDQPIQVLGNDDCPFRILDAKVKELPAARFRKLTGKTVTIDAVPSVPEVTVINSSDKTITEFILAVRNPQTGTGRAFAQRSVAIAPGEVYVVKRGHFVGPEAATAIGERGEIRKTPIWPKMNSEQYWLQFAPLADLYVTVGRVTFDDGSVWTIKEGGQAR